MTEKVVKAEATNGNVVFEFDGVEYSVPTPKRWPLKVVRAQEEGKFLRTFEALLGAKQWKKFDPDEERTAEDLEKFMEAMFEAVELDPKA